MAKLYYKSIVAGLMKDDNGAKTVNKVPSLWREKVIKLLEDNGYTVTKDGTVLKNEE